MRLFFKIIPWLLTIVLALVIYLTQAFRDRASTDIAFDHTVILERMEAMGKVELVKYNFKEITEARRLSPEFFRIFKLGPDSRAVLIAKGEAAGCIDLTQIAEGDVIESGDTLIVRLPPPELCYYKLDLENTSLYLLETGFFVDQEKFVEEAYRNAERQIRKAALESGILEQTIANAEIILRPVFEEISGKKVILNFIKEERIEQK